MGQYTKTKFDEEAGQTQYSLSCCGLCYLSRAQRLVCACAVSLPLVLVTSLLATLVIRALALSERFQLETLSDDDIAFISPSNRTVNEWTRNLGNSIKIPTISWNDTNQNNEELENLHIFLRETFPTVFGSPDIVKVTPVNSLSLLLRVQGSVITENPYLLAAHLDVVPPGDLSRWDHDPFLGDIVEEDGTEFVFGRGAIDDKHSLMGILQSLETILVSGDRPRRTFYIGLGHDEEISGHQGAALISRELQSQLEENEETLEFLLDEGMTVMQGVVPGLEDPALYIGVVEKGWASLELRVEAAQKHSSTPPRHSAAGILAGALSRLEKKRSPAKFGSGPERDTMQYLAPHMSFMYKLGLANLWMLGELVSGILGKDENTDAIQRTTTAITIVQAGFKDNVVPGEARAVVNHRIHPTESLEDILKHDREVINDDRVEIKTLGYFPPPSISPYSNDVTPFQIVANSALQVFPTGHIAPGTLVANTDTKHYLNLTDNIYRFTPAFTTKSDISRFHGYNERISVANYVQVVEFYHRVIRNADTRLSEKYSREEGSGSGSSEGEGSAEDDGSASFSEENVAEVDGYVLMETLE